MSAMINTYRNTAKVVQISRNKFVAAYYCKTILVNLQVGSEELDIVVNRLRQKNKLPIEFKWLDNKNII